MKILQEDGILIKNLYLSKRYGAQRMLHEFPDWGLETWEHRRSAKENTQDGYTSVWQPRSGRPRSARRSGGSRAQSGGQAKKHRSARDILCETSILCLSVYRIIHRDLQLKCFKRRRAQLLSEANRISHLTH